MEKDIAYVLLTEEQIKEKVKELAEYDDRSLSSYINIVLKEHLDKLEKQ